MIKAFVRMLFRCTLVVTFLAALAVIGLSLVEGAPNWWQLAWLAPVACIAGMFLVMIYRTKRTKRNKEVDASPTISVMEWRSELVGPNDRPVMHHQGDVYDFVHNNPTATDPVS